MATGRRAGGGGTVTPAGRTAARVAAGRGRALGGRPLAPAPRQPGRVRAAPVATPNRRGHAVRRRPAADRGEGVFGRPRADPRPLPRTGRRTGEEVPFAEPPLRPAGERRRVHPGREAAVPGGAGAAARRAAGGAAERAGGGSAQSDRLPPAAGKRGSGRPPRGRFHGRHPSTGAARADRRGRPRECGPAGGAVRHHRSVPELVRAGVAGRPAAAGGGVGGFRGGRAVVGCFSPRSLAVAARRITSSPAASANTPAASSRPIPPSPRPWAPPRRPTTGCRSPRTAGTPPRRSWRAGARR